MSYHVLAYYQFVSLEDPLLEIKKHKEFFNGRDVAGRIYISEEGINGQMSGSVSDCEAYTNWMKDDARFATLEFKVHTHHENIFPRMTVKYRKQLVALDEQVNPHEGGNRLSPKEWRETLESEEDFLLLDVRNHYETEIGHFENSICPPLEKFREFPAYVDQLKETVDPKKKVLMCCTGGIRCELYSALMKKKGFTDVYQLDGGIINYGLEEGNSHWKGKLFVFDDRMAVAIDGKEETNAISKCRHCDNTSDRYYNCANMDCNELFLCCDECHKNYLGTCCEGCRCADRIRPYDPKNGNKPFRRKHLIV